MKNMTKKLAACVCGLLVFSIASNTHAAGLAGTWKGFCDNRDIKLVLSQTDLQISGTLELGRETFTVEGSTDNSSDNGTLTLAGTGGNGIFPRSCTADFSIPAPGRMTGTVTVRTSFGLKLFSGQASLVNPEVQVDFTLVIGHAQKPSNIYLFFTVQDGNGNPVTGLKDADFEIYEDDRLISQYESSQTIFPNPSVYTMDTVLLLDMSGSVLNADASVFASLKDSAAAFLDNVVGEQGQEAAIYYFDGQAQIHKLAEFSKDITSLKATIQSLTVSGIKAAEGYDPSTNLNGAVQQGLAALDAARTAAGTDKLFIGTLVTFTDGTDQAHLVTDAAAVASVNASTHYSFTIGLGAEIDEAHLKDLGKSGFAWAQNSDDLSGAFAEIAATISSQSDKRYILGYCTPSRSGDHQVKLSVKKRPGELNFAFNADGFSGGCDPNDILGGMIPGDADRCLFTVEPATIYRPLLARSKRIGLTLSCDKAFFSRKSTVEISGMTVLATRYVWGKLHVTAVLPPKSLKGGYDITVNTTEGKLICFDVLTVK